MGPLLSLLTVMPHQMPSYAKALLEHWGVAVEDIPTSDAAHKQESDFLANFSGVRVLIEEKTKEDDPAYLAQRAEELEGGRFTRRPCRFGATKRCQAWYAMRLTN